MEMPSTGQWPGKEPESTDNRPEDGVQDLGQVKAGLGKDGGSSEERPQGLDGMEKAQGMAEENIKGGKGDVT